MTPKLCIAISTATLRALLDFQSERGKELDPADLADLAIRAWLHHQKDLAKPAGQRGYFWKKLFLPEGTRLRVSNYQMTRYAAIVGDDLVYESMTTSPNRFVQMTLGSARNAWEVVYIQMPGTGSNARATAPCPVGGPAAHLACRGPACPAIAARLRGTAQDIPAR